MKVTGHQRGRKKGVPIYFDPDQIEAVNEWRSRMGLNFSEAVRTLIEWGLEADEAAAPRRGLPDRHLHREAPTDA